MFLRFPTLGFRVLHHIFLQRHTKKSLRSICLRSLTTGKPFTSLRLCNCKARDILHPIRPAQSQPRRLFSSKLPPHIRVTLPALSPTMATGTIVSWDKKVGDRLAEGDLLAQIETDKATMGFETPDEGYLAKILVEAGTRDVPIGRLVCIIVEAEADIAAFADFKDGGEEAVSSTTPSVPASTPPAAPEASAPSSSAKYPPHNAVTLPALSPTMSTGSILSWDKKVGDRLAEGDLLAEIETDKATMAMETPDEGFLAKILVPAGTRDVPIGRVICVIVAEQADVAAFADYKDAGASGASGYPVAAAVKIPAAAPAAAAPVPSVAPSSAAAASSGGGGRVYASPMARRLAEVQKLRLEGKGSGLYDSLTSKDLSASKPATTGVATAPIPKPGKTAAAAAATGATGPGAFTDHPVTGVRAIIGQRLLESKLTIPHFYASIECQMDAVQHMRTDLNRQLAADGVRLTVNDFVLKACAVANRRVPALNSCWLGTAIRQFESVDIAVAVNSDKGLITPIVWQTERRGLLEISAEVRRLAARAKEGSLQPAEFQGGSFTVSNLGMFGVSSFSAIINPPQTSILAVAGSLERLQPDEAAKRGWRVTQWMTVTLSCDHRAVDGAAAAEWLRVFRQLMQEPHAMLL